MRGVRPVTAAVRVCLAVARLGFNVIEVLARIDRVVLENSQQCVKATRKQRTQARSNPIYPLIMGKRAIDDIRAKRASWIERAASEVIACEPSIISASAYEYV